MRLAIVGGKLQGTEAAYLAAKAGHETVLVDRREAPPAAGFADRHVAMDVTADEARSRAVLAACDAVLPACEDEAALVWLTEHVPRWGVPLLFDLDAYRVTASKLASNALFARLGVPRPRPWPEGRFPLVVKPSTASGSEGVSVVRDEAALTAARTALEAAGSEVVVEEFVAGPSLSLEVLCWNAQAVPLQITGLEFDEAYDCKRVVAPVEAADAAVTPLVLEAFDRVSTTLADGLGLQGLMDVEVMVHDGQPKVLEIDARLPSQTPTAVYWSSGLNIVELLVRTVADGYVPAVDREPRRACVYQHVRAADGRLAVAGEHVMGAARPLALVPGFFGAHEALTDYEPGRATWAATLITLGATVAEAREAAEEVVAGLAAAENLQLQPEVECQ
jgi:3-methylornithine--L-lysine ligase